MASIWSLDGNDIYVDTFSEDARAQLAELNPISSTTSIFHALFEPTDVFQAGGTVIGESVKNAIQATKGSIVTLISDLSPLGFDVLVIDVSANRVIAFKQTVDTSFPDDAPVYKVTLMLRPQ